MNVARPALTRNLLQKMEMWLALTKARQFEGRVCKTAYNKSNIMLSRMLFRQTGWLLSAAALLASCGSPQRTPESARKLTVAAAANLTDVFGEVGPAFKAQTGIDVVFSYAATAELAQQ